MSVRSHIAKSVDGILIHYAVQGSGAPALVFVHGWCCDRHYWEQQVDHFAPHYTVVRLDLAGHGASGRDRAQWTVPAFGQDVVAVAKQLGLEQVVLIGHSMGGRVIVEAARRLPDTVIGLVGAETWHHVGHVQTPAQVAAFLAPFRADFVEAMHALVPKLFAPTADAALVEEVVAAMAESPPHIGIGAWEESVVYNRVVRERLQEIRVPKIAINSAYPLTTNREALKACGVEVVFMSGVGHFVMMEDRQTFNRRLGEVMQAFVTAVGRRA
jgi:pimeloyl-ACP methyl ester carboxylesterase